MNKFVLTALVGCLFGILMLIVVSEGQHYGRDINLQDDAERRIDLDAKETIDSNDQGFEDDLQQSRNTPDSDDADLDEGDVDKGVYDPQGDDVVG